MFISFNRVTLIDSYGKILGGQIMKQTLVLVLYV